MIKVEFYGDDYTGDGELAKSIDGSSSAVVAIYDESMSAAESWTSKDLPAIADILNEMTKIAVSKVNFVVDSNPDLAVVKDVIRMMGTGRILSAPEVITNPETIH